MEFVVRAAKPSESLDSAALKKLPGVVRACETILLGRILEQIERYPTAARLIEFSCDCTPVSVRQSVSVSSSAKTVSTRGKSGEEILVQQVFVSLVMPSGEMLHNIYFPLPMKLLHGKSMASLASCVPDKSTWAALIGGVRHVTVVCQTHDRANTWKFRKAVASLCVQGALPSVAEGSGSAYEKAFIWPVTLGCAAHDAHNGLRWGLQCSEVWSDDTVRDAYICMAALKECYRQVALNIHSWIREVLVAVPVMGMDERGIYAQAFSVLGLEADMLALVTEDIQLRWMPASQSLLVSEVFVSQPDWLATLSSILLDVWRLPSFSASRWITVGAGCRRLSMSIFTGLEHCVRMLHQQSHLTTYTFHGCERYNAEVGTFAVVAGLASYVPDGFLKKLLHEPALCQVYTECVDELDSAARV
eukprot:6461570-Amphidinium_carterae.1